MWENWDTRRGQRKTGVSQENLEGWQVWWNLTDKAILRKMGGIYVTYVADADKEQWHVWTQCGR